MSQGRTHGRNWEQLSQRCSHVTYTSMSPPSAQNPPPLFFHGFLASGPEATLQIGTVSTLSTEEFQTGELRLPGRRPTTGWPPSTHSCCPAKFQSPRKTGHVTFPYPMPSAHQSRQKSSLRNQARALVPMAGFYVWKTHFCLYLSQITIAEHKVFHYSSVVLASHVHKPFQF